MFSPVSRTILSRMQPNSYESKVTFNNRNIYGDSGTIAARGIAAGAFSNVRVVGNISDYVGSRKLTALVQQFQHKS